jgi:sulfopyruvate decarboxylase subunit beta|tara:strand:+ start:605 stop:1147 length:543 start_codon:yes stop_codon:yes gene_type:complete
MVTVSAKSKLHESGLAGVEIIDQLRRSKIEFVVAVPDIVTCDGLLWPLTNAADITVVPVCKEDEGVSICAAMSYCDRRALLLIQHTGFLDSINAIRAIAVEYELPICIMVGLQGMEPDRKLKDSDSYGIRIMEPILDAMGIDHGTLREAEDAKMITAAIDGAYTKSRPFVFLIGNSPSSS